MTAILANRMEFVPFFDVTNGNPNGDPDANNRPRTDPETGHGVVSNVCIKRAIRDYLGFKMEGEKGYEIYHANGVVLNNQQMRAYTAYNLKPEEKKLPKEERAAAKVINWMTDNFYDIRTFGAVMSTEVNTGTVRGPVQIEFARSIEPVLPQEIAITRQSVTNEKDEHKERTMGSKYILPYGLYRVHGYINAPLAEKTGFTERDLEVLLDAMQNMFDFTRSATRGEMVARELIIFRHDSKFGNAPAHRLFERVDVRRVYKGEEFDVDSAEAEMLPPARRFKDYVIHIDDANMPAGVSIQRPWA